MAKRLSSATHAASFTGDIKPENILVVREAEGLRPRVNRLSGWPTHPGPPAYAKRSIRGDRFVSEPRAGLGQGHRHALRSLFARASFCTSVQAGQPPFTGEVFSVQLHIASDVPNRCVSSARRWMTKSNPLSCSVWKKIRRCVHKGRGTLPRRCCDFPLSFGRNGSRTGVCFSAYRAENGSKRPPVLPTFIGREKEFAELQSRLNMGNRGRMPVRCCFRARQAIGKSRLLDKLGRLARAKKSVCSRAFC